jgi:3'-5' exonuclease
MVGTLPQGGSLLEQRLLTLIDRLGGRVALGELDRKYAPAKALHRDLKSIQAKSVKEAIDHNKLPCIDRVKSSKKTYLKRSSHGNTIVASNVVASTPIPPPAESALPTVPDATAGTESIQLIDSVSMLDELRNRPLFATRHDASSSSSAFNLLSPLTWVQDAMRSKIAAAVDCEGGSEGLYMIQVATKDEIYVFDCVKLEQQQVFVLLIPFLSDSNVVKLFHDMHKFAALCATNFDLQGGLQSSFRGAFDTQLAVEAMETGQYHAGFGAMLNHFGLQNVPMARSIKKKENKERFQHRPISRDALLLATDKVRLLVDAFDKIHSTMGSNLWTAVLRASEVRMRQAYETDGMRQVCFDMANSYGLASPELLQELRPNDMFVQAPLVVSNETSALLAMLPEDLLVDIRDRTESISDIVLDKGRIPLAWVSGRRIILGNGRMVEYEEIIDIVEKLGGFGTDNRAGLERQLHRISAIRNRDKDIIGLTMRVGRHVAGNADMIVDLLFAYEDSSILFLGEPGSGKKRVCSSLTVVCSPYN